MTEPATIDVCIATFKRPALLSMLFASLGKQDLSGIRMRIVVVDNDCAESARPVVDEYRIAASHEVVYEVVYDVEPQQNIALARNRALSHVRSDYFAFIDDDELASPRWLRFLLDSLIEYEADIVFGPVVSALPMGAPSWAPSCFRRQRRRSGELLQFGSTNNVMAERSIIEGRSERFNPAFGLTGGEDTDFFYRQFLAGRRLVWCDEAVVSEPVPDARLTLKWVRRRGFRDGQTYHRIFVRRYSNYGKAIWFAAKTVQLLAGVLAAPFARIISYRSYVALTIRIAAASGQLSCWFSGENFEEYNIRRYR